MRLLIRTVLHFYEISSLNFQSDVKLSMFHIYCEGILCLKNLVEETAFFILNY